MSKKLTLNIDDDIIQFAHNYAKNTNQSISTIVEKYFERLKEKKQKESLSPETEELYGILEKEPLPDKKEMRKALYEKNIN